MKVHSLLVISSILLSVSISECKKRKRKQDVERIVGGSLADIKKYPFVALMWVVDRIHCGSTIINLKYVLTAAHCMEDLTEEYIPHTSIFAGATMADGEDGDRYDVEAMIPHQKYNDDTMHNDIGLIRIKGKFKYGPKVQKINIAAPDLVVPVDVKCTVLGWGHSTVRMSSRLHMADVPVVSLDICKARYKIVYDVTEKQLCAGYREGGIDACQGDSGGPMIFDDILVGVVSYGFGCARPNYPGVYTNVASYTDWILENAQ